MNFLRFKPLKKRLRAEILFHLLQDTQKRRLFQQVSHSTAPVFLCKYYISCKKENLICIGLDLCRIERVCGIYPPFSQNGSLRFAEDKFIFLKYVRRILFIFIP